MSAQQKVTTPLIVCGTIIVIALIGGVIFMSQGSNDNVKFIIVNGMLGTVGTILASLFVARKVEQASEKSEEMHDDLKNGLIPAKVEETLNRMAEDPNCPTVVTYNAENENGDGHLPALP